MTLDILDMIAAAPRVFMSITIPDVIDIILLTLLLIAVIRFMSETRATQLLKGIGLIALLYLLVWLGQLKVMTYLFQNFFLQWGLVAIVVVFQPEIRRLLEKVGTTAKVRIPFLAYFEKADAQKVIERDTAITAISDACERLSRTKTGALIVIERQTKLQNIIEKSTIVDAKPSPEQQDIRGWVLPAAAGAAGPRVHRPGAWLTSPRGDRNVRELRRGGHHRIRGNRSCFRGKIGTDNPFDQRIQPQGMAAEDPARRNAAPRAVKVKGQEEKAVRQQ